LKPVTTAVQLGVAARIAYTKTGASASLKELTVSRLTLLIDEVLRNPEYRDNANRLRQVMAKTNGLEKAVDLLEEALGLASFSIELEAGRMSSPLGV
jgi:zeaxanthin glucosyltransferase